MAEITFGRLTDLGLREAWSHEALDFTPWLAANLDHIGEAIGIPLELIGTEVPVESYSADILTRNPQDGTVVLIENQLEKTDHTHLGQIMTYLAGLEAQTVVWIAPRFQEAHLSAIRWLNQHTVDGFSFFAVKLRVVRIMDSPLAPILEVVEKPSGWERQLATARRASSGADNTMGDLRLTFWREYGARHPQAVAQGVRPARLSYCWSPIIENQLYVALWVGSPQSGIFVRGGYGADPALVTDLLASYEQVLTTRLQASWGGRDGKFLGRTIPISLSDESRREQLIDELEDLRKQYTNVLREVVVPDLQDLAGDPSPPAQSALPP